MTMRRLLALLLAALLFIPSAPAKEYWGISGRPLTCRQDRLGCSILQTVMTGSLAAFDHSNDLDARVFSAVLSQLKSVTEDDLLHFCDEFSVEHAFILRSYYIAMANCLWADIIATPAKDESAYNARLVFYLFLYPEGHENAGEQIAAIRGLLTGDVIASLAEADDLPVAFVEWLLVGDGETE